MVRKMFLTAALLVCTAVAAAPPRISFQRVLAAPHNPSGAEDIAIVYAIGDNARIATFLDAFLDYGNRSGSLRMYDAVALKRKVRADLHLRVNAFACRTGEQAGEGSYNDADGKRIRRTQYWATAECNSKIEVLRPDTAVTISSFRVIGEGTSSRSERVTDEEIGVALDEAARHAARAALEQIAPRHIRETIALDETAPAFIEGFAMVKAGRLSQTRRIWERALRKEPDSAPLRHNLAAVCEALDDLTCALDNFTHAQRLDTSSLNHKIELEMFRRRNGKR